jgi:hypothetical protein
MIDVDNLAHRIAEKCKEIGAENAYEVAIHLANFFGYCDRVLDNRLDEERDLFYMLEDAGILAVKKEETTLPNGEEWFIYWWYIKPENQNKKVQEVKTEEQKLYESVFQKFIEQNADN